MTSNRADAQPLHRPHPDAVVPEMQRDLRAAVHAFEADCGSSKSLTAVTTAFKNAAAVLDAAAPPVVPDHAFQVGERVVRDAPVLQPGSSLIHGFRFCRI